MKTFFFQKEKEELISLRLLYDFLLEIVRSFLKNETIMTPIPFWTCLKRNWCHNGQHADETLNNKKRVFLMQAV